MKHNKENSQEQAEIIKMIAFPVMMLDVEYCREAAKCFMDQASRQESMAVLNPSHSQIQNDILRKQGEALKFLCDYVDALKQVEQLKQDLSLENANKDRISKLFI
jgi:hypothetical protein